MVKGPPAGIAGEFVGRQTVCLAMCGDCGNDLEEVADDLDSCFRFGTNGNEVVKRITSVGRVCVAVSARFLLLRSCSYQSLPP
jgi:hypothetical protein